MCFEESIETRIYIDNLGMPIPGATAVEFPTETNSAPNDVCCSIGCENRDEGNERAYYLDACTSSNPVPGEPVYSIEDFQHCVKTTVSVTTHTFTGGDEACTSEST